MEAFLNNYNILIKKSGIDYECNQIYLGVYKNIKFTEGAKNLLNFFRVTV